MGLRIEDVEVVQYTEGPTVFARPDFDRIGRIPALWPEWHATDRPSAIAVKDKNTALSWSAFSDRIRRWCNAVLEAVGPRPGAVLLACDTGVAGYAAMLGAMRAGAVVVCLDPSDGPERGSILLEETLPCLIICDSAGGACVPASDLIRMPVGDPGSAPSVEPPELHSDEAARCVFTSGSTGRPTAAIWTHENLLQKAWEGVATNSCRPSDKCAGFFSFSYAASSHMFPALAAGATLCFWNTRRDPLNGLLPWLASEKISSLIATPGLLRPVWQQQAIQPVNLQELRVVTLGGDRIFPQDVGDALAHVGPDGVVLSLLAGTEVGSVSMGVHSVPPPAGVERLPAGFPLPGVLLQIRGPEGSEVPQGEEGALFVAKQVTMPKPFIGHESFVWRSVSPVVEPVFRPTGDRARFMADGQLDVLGRVGMRVKVRGYSVDLAEIENVLAAVAGVKRCAVVLSADQLHPRLAAHVERESESLTAKDLRSAISGSLPRYAVPGIIQFWDSLPATSRGKLDRKVLQDVSIVAEADGSLQPPADEIEADLHKIWTRVLKVGDLGVTDDFFDVGGDSLMAFELIVAIEQAFEVEVAPISMLARSTIRAQADLIRLGGSKRGDLLVPLRRGTGPGTVVLVAGRGGSIYYAQRLSIKFPESWSCYGLQLDDPTQAESFATVADLARANVEALMVEQPEPPFVLYGGSFGGHVAWAMAGQMAEMGVPVELVVLGDTYQPGFTIRPLRISSKLRRLPHVMRYIPKSRAYARRRQYLTDPRLFAKRLGQWARTRTRRFLRHLSPMTTAEAAVLSGTKAIGKAQERMLDGWTPACLEVACGFIETEEGAFAHKDWIAYADGALWHEAIPASIHADIFTVRLGDVSEILNRELTRITSDEDLEAAVATDSPAIAPAAQERTDRG